MVPQEYDVEITYYSILNFNAGGNFGGYAGQ